MLVASSLAVLSLLLPPVSIVSSAAVALITLRRGANEGLYVLICACLSSAILGFFLFNSVQVALLFALVLWLPVWVISIVLREGKHLSVAVEIAVLLGILGVIGCYLYVDEPGRIWFSILSQMIEPIIAEGTDVPIEDIKKSVQLFSRFMTGGISAGTVYGLLFGLFMARWWQSALYNPGGFRREYLSLRVHPPMAIVSIVVVTMAWFMSGIVSEICWNISILFVVLYTFVGTAILHASFSEVKLKRFMVPFLYITLVLVPHMIAIVVVVGLVDVWLDLRSKILKKTDS